VVDPKARAAEIIEKFHITSLPIPVEQIAEKLGAKVIKRSDFSDELCGMIIKEDGVVIIGVNEAHPKSRQRFTIAHEIGHFVMHSEIIDKVHVDKTFNYALKRDGRSKIGEDRMEIEANKFAAELLMPSELLKKELKTGYFDFENGLEDLAKKYEVSVQAMSIKMMDVFPGVYKDKF